MWIKPSTPSAISTNTPKLSLIHICPAEGLSRDDEAAGYWEKFLPKAHIINGNKHDNFWEMGDTGTCGPCSEIHIDLRPAEERAKISGRDLGNESPEE